MTEPLLHVEGLSVDYEVGAGTFHALTDVALDLFPQQVVGIVGETGCGKSTLGHSIPRLLPEPPARVKSGKIVFQGTDLLQVPKWKIPMVRGTGIGMIFQEPINSLNPAMRIYDQVAEAVRIRALREAGKLPAFRPGPNPFDYSRRPTPKAADVLGGRFVGGAVQNAASSRAPAPTDSKEIRKTVLDFLRLVRINDPETILGLYPHELSGGMRQRIMIAMALSERPSLLIADEPTSALDVTIQAQVLTLMKELMEEVRTAILFISHDLGVIADIADVVGVMYAGHLVEFGPVADVFENSRHPYTKGLLRAIPTKYKMDGRLPSLSGSVPNLARIPPGCPFHPRCPLARPNCQVDPGPSLTGAEGHEHLTVIDGLTTHVAACYYSNEVPGLP